MRKMLACNCLNVIIESEANDFLKVTPDLLDLTEIEQNDDFFKQELRQVEKLTKISKENPGLVVARTVGSWVVHQCINCGVHTHGVHRERGASCVLVSSGLLTSLSIAALQNSELYSSTFNILVTPKEQENTTKHLDDFPPEVQLSLGSLRQRITETVNNEVAATEERIRRYSEQEYAALEDFKDKSHREHKILTWLIVNSKINNSEAVKLQPTREMSSPVATEISRPHLNSVPAPVASKKSDIIKPKHNLVTNLASKPKRSASMQISPVSYGNSFDSEGLFELEGMDNANSCTESEAEDSDNEVSEPLKDGATPVSRYRTNSYNLAKSLPMNIPSFMSPFHNHSKDDHDEVMPRRGEDPLDIAASIKALAKSVHGDAIFGDLPRPRLSTQI